MPEFAKSNFDKHTLKWTDGERSAFKGTAVRGTGVNFPPKMTLWLAG